MPSTNFVKEAGLALALFFGTPMKEHHGAKRIRFEGGMGGTEPLLLIFGTGMRYEMMKCHCGKRVMLDLQEEHHCWGLLWRPCCCSHPPEV